MAAAEVGRGARAFQSTLKDLGVSASPAEIKQLAKVGANSPGNSHRDLMRKLSKESTMPQTYTAETQFWNTRLNRPYKGKINFLLPFEILLILVALGSIENWTSFSPSQDELQATLKNWSERMGVSFVDLIALGLWGDGAPREYASHCQ